MREVVHTRIGEVTSNFQYMSNVGNVEEYFYCIISSNKTTEHFSVKARQENTVML